MECEEVNDHVALWHKALLGPRAHVLMVPSILIHIQAAPTEHLYCTRYQDGIETLCSGTSDTS